MEKLLTIQEAAELLCVTPRTVQALRQRGELTAIKVGACVRFERAELERFIEASREKRSGSTWNPRRFRYTPGMKVV